MRKYIAKLTKNIELEIPFTSTDVLTGNEIAHHTVPFTMSAGDRQFKRLKDCKAWIARMNKDYGTDTAIFIA